MTIRLNGQTSGYVELEAPATAGSNTLVLPTNNGTSGQYLQTNGSGALSWQTVASLSNAQDGTGTDFQFNSGYGSVATAYGVRAWINFDGQAATVGTGRGSANMDAVTDNGTGDYTLNFTNNMPDVNYGVLLTAERDATNYLAGAWVQSRAVGSVDIYSGLVNDTSILAGWDITGVHAAIVR